MIKNSKQRAYLAGLAANIESSMQIGKSQLTPEIINAVNDLFNNRELVKITVLKTCEEDLRSIAEKIGSRTHSDVVKVIGRKIILYKEGKDDKKVIQLP